MRFIVTIGERELEVEATPSNPGVLVSRGAERVPVRLEGVPGSKIYTLHVGDQTFRVALIPDPSPTAGVRGVLVSWRGYEFPVKVERAVTRRYRVLLRKQPQAHRAPHIHTITSHMPGLIAQIFITEGQRVEAGDRLWLLEAMKMENEVRAPVAGVIEKLYIQSGTPVEKDQPICTIREGDAP